MRTSTGKLVSLLGLAACLLRKSLGRPAAHISSLSLLHHGFVSCREPVQLKACPAQSGWKLKPVLNSHWTQATKHRSRWLTAGRSSTADLDRFTRSHGTTALLCGVAAGFAAGGLFGAWLVSRRHARPPPRVPATAWNQHWHSAAQRSVGAGLIAGDAAQQRTAQSTARWGRVVRVG